MGDVITLVRGALPDLEEPCPECRGAGAVLSPEWESYYAEREALAGARYGGGQDPHRVPPDPEPPEGPEEVECARCRGRGRIPSPFGERVLDLVRRHLLDAVWDDLARLEARTEAKIRRLEEGRS
ncbi:MAG TPA: hypothetical protein VNO79_05955 [Actinomycetota bacterium]|nr:hypothetical protein [Actinomycetota bacterium]